MDSRLKTEVKRLDQLGAKFADQLAKVQHLTEEAKGEGHLDRELVALLLERAPVKDPVPEWVVSGQRMMAEHCAQCASMQRYIEWADQNPVTALLLFIRRRLKEEKNVDALDELYCIDQKLKRIGVLDLLLEKEKKRMETLKRGEHAHGQ